MKATELFSTLEAQRVGVAAEPVPPGDGSAPSESEGWPEYCRQLVQYAPDRAFESCAVRLLGNGSTVVVSIVGECGGDSCSVEGWVYTEVLGRFVAMPGDIGGTLAADPSGQFLLIDQATELSIPHPEDVELRDPLGGNDEIITARIDLPSMKVTPFAACFSPALSPGGRWFVCRNRVGDVLRFAVTGGKPKRIVKAGVPKDKLRWVPYAYGHPDAVEFPSATLLRYTLELETLKTHEVPWSE